ncbi:hypothetical protein [Lichenibacterium dinghuense]|uniref:hypothetical protein n=1 Tax=Lichenibacterium dinghuense TaxID=2895977 RepID=UPI001F2BF216|nr:hypothetical protein [Lichenibacterium sp. 6Y81]
MLYKLGDAVRLRDGSAMREGLDPWEDATGRVVAIFDDMTPPRLNVMYGEHGPFLSTVLASEFVADRPFDGAPF